MKKEILLILCYLLRGFNPTPSPFRRGGEGLGFPLLAFCLLLLFNACKKDLPPPIAEDPVFEVSYQLDGQAYTKTAGLNDQYLFTDAEYQDEYWYFSGSFANATCPTVDCPGTLRFILQNNNVGNNFDSTWNTGVFPFYDNTAQYSTSFSYSSDNPGNPEVFWNLNDIDFFDGVQIVFNTSFLELDVFQSAQHPNGIVVESRQLFQPPNNSFCLRTAMQVTADSMGSGSIKLTALPEPAAGNYNYTWNISGIDTSMVQTDWLPDATYAVTVSDVDGNCSAEVSMRNLPDTFSYIHSGLVTGNAVLLTGKQIGPIVEWIDVQGFRWRSDWGNQQFPANFFEVLEIKDYDRNENGLTTKWLRVRWNCRLYNDVGASVPISGVGVIAVGWPG